MCEDTHLGAGGAITVHREHVGRAFGKVSVESVVKKACVVNFLVMSAGFWVVVDCNNPPFPSVTSRKALLKEAVPCPQS